MNTYELVLIGFDGSTDETDHLIVWVNTNEEIIEKISQNACVRDYNLMERYTTLSITDGVDMEVVNSEQLENLFEFIENKCK
jgi:hypothetical protein